MQRASQYDSRAEERLAVAMTAELRATAPTARSSVGELSADALGVSVAEFVGPRIPVEDVTVAHAGQAIPRNLYVQSRLVDPQRRRQVISRPRLLQQLASGRTVVVRNVDLHAEPCGRLAAEIEHREGARVNCSMFLTQGGFRGFALHWDAYDTLVVQLEGAKRWRIFDSGSMPRGAQVLPHGEEARAGEPVDEFLLTPGDILLIRSGVPHQAAAEGGLSCHLSFSVVRPTMGEGLRHVVRLAEATEAGRRVLPPSYAERPEEVAELLAAALRDLAGDPSLLAAAVQDLATTELGDHRVPQAAAELSPGGDR